MNDDDIRAAAKAAELACDSGDSRGSIIARGQEDEDLMPYLRRFAEACVAAERERLAQRCEEVAAHDYDLGLMSPKQVALYLAGVCRSGAA